MARIKIKDLNVNLEELKKKDPEILKKIRGGSSPFVSVSGACYGGAGGRMSSSCINEPALFMSALPPYISPS